MLVILKINIIFFRVLLLSFCFLIVAASVGHVWLLQLA